MFTNAEYLYLLRAHDGRVFRNSGLPITLQSDLYDGPVPLEDTYHILGDSAFPLAKEVMTPYTKPRTRGLTAEEKLFNRHLSSKRQVGRLHNVCGFLVPVLARTELLIILWEKNGLCADLA